MENIDFDRPWKNDKRSWIYYKDKIEEKIEQSNGEKVKRNPNIICEEVDGNMFLLDCETARLSIWSREWETFTDVGVSALINQVEQNGAWDSREVFKETKIYYKGIELQNSYIVVDAGILEFIDIKGELERKYININRQGFTEEGQQFFEEQLYPGLLEAIRKVLRYLEKTEHLDRFCEVIKRECENDADRRQLIHLVVSVAVLAYYAMREEWKLSEKLYEPGNKIENGWAKLLEKLDGILSGHRNLLDELGKKSSFFSMSAVTMEGSMKGALRNGTKLQQKFSFLQIFLSQNHWAILQERKDSYDNWTDYLVLLESGKEYYNSIEYQKIVSVPHLEDDDEILEGWGKRLCEIRSSYLSGGDSSQQLILNWLLKNVPTVGLFSNEEGNVRASVLANKVYPSIYLNENFKFLLLQRMMKQVDEKGIQRFSTITWQRREQLACRRLSSGIYFVKRGYLSDYTYYKMVVPFDGGLWKEWGKALGKKGEKNEKMEALLGILDAMNIEGVLRRGEGCENELKNHLQKRSSGILMNMAMRVFDAVSENIVNKHYKQESTVEEILGHASGLVGQWRTIYYNAATKYIKEESASLGSETMGLSDTAENFERMLGFTQLCDMWLYCCQESDIIFKTVCEVDKIYEQYVAVNHDFEKREKIMVDYVCDRLCLKVEREVVQKGLEDYKEELLDLMRKMELLELRQRLESLKTKYSMYLFGLDAMYNNKEN